STAPSSPEISEFPARLAAVLDEDLNTAQAVGHLAGLLKAVNEMCDKALAKKGAVSRTTYEAAARGLEVAGEVLGLGLDDPEAFLNRIRDRRVAKMGVDKAWVEDCLARRNQARS